MTAINAISALESDCKNGNITSQRDAEIFLSNYDAKTQERLIFAIYFGRDHIHRETADPEGLENTSQLDHISPTDYSRIVYEKRSSIPTYLESAVRCASASNLDLNNT